jgi:hypothetical protein
LYVGVSCEECGVHDEGRPSTNGVRCDRCGRFGTAPENYCHKHDLQYGDIYPEDKHCPYCREERRQREEMAHVVTRDPLAEPW